MPAKKKAKAEKSVAEKRVEARSSAKYRKLREAGKTDSEALEEIVGAS